MDIKKFESDANVNLNLEKAYCIKEEGRFKKDNFSALVPELVKKGGIDTLILQTGSIEITNIDVNRAMMDITKDMKEYKKEWYSKVEEDSKNLFGLAEDAIASDAKLTVVIVKRLQRFDRASKDMSKLKSQLSKFANHVYDNMWLKQGSPDRIHIVDLEMDCEHYPYLKDIIYGKQSDLRYDGIHPIGAGGSRQFTYRAVQKVLPIICQPLCSTHQPKPRQTRSFRTQKRAENRNHSNLKQTQFQHQSARNSHGGKRSNKSYAEAVYTVPTENFYTPLNC